jgi:hypothetical protein
MPHKTFVAGEEALAADVNTYLMGQAVARFPNAAGRSAAITAPVPGMLSYLTDTGRLEQYTDKSSPAGWHLPWGMPWGQIVADVLPAGVSGITTVGFIPGSAISTGSVANRRVLVTFTATLQKANDSIGTVTVRLVRVSPGEDAGVVSLHPNFRGAVTLRNTYVNLTGSAQVDAACDTGSVGLGGMRLTAHDMGPA